MGGKFDEVGEVGGVRCDCESLENKAEGLNGME